MSTKHERQESKAVILQALKEQPGPLALHWLGPLHQRKSRTGLRLGIHARFRHVGADAPPLDFSIPMEAFHLLAAGSRWSYGTFNGYAGGRSGWARLNLPSLDVKVAHRAVPPSEVIPEWAYALHGMESPGAVRIVPVDQGPDLVFPIAEMVRVWYLFHPRMLRVLLGDGISRPRSMSRKDLPWDPQGTYPTGDGAHVTYDTSFGDASMKRLARLLFDAEAKKAVGSFSRRLQQYSASESFDFPYTVPPLQDHPLLKIHYLDIPAWEGHRPLRRLVLSVLAVRHPPPYRFITWDATQDNRPDSEGDPNRPIYPAHGAPVILSDAEGVTLAGGDADTGMEGVPTHMLSFDDDAYHVPTERLPRKDATHRAGGPRPEPVRVSQVGPDTGDRGDPGVAEFAAGDMQPGPLEDKTRGAPPIVLIRMRTVFDRAIDLLTTELPGWTVAYLALAGMDNGVLDIVHEERPDYRFLILHARGSGRHVYALHGTAVDCETQHQLLACRQPSWQPLTTQQFNQWLAGVPYPQRPVLVDKEPTGLKVIPRAFNHQRQPANFDEATWVEQFAQNVAKAVLAIARG